MRTLHAFAPAKLNLYLHITGRRTDGYHDLDSLVAFAGVGDQLRLDPSNQFDFALEGPQAAKLEDESADNNLAVKAMKSLAELVGRPLNVKLTLVKNLPVASGIGGGSSDAAAALRLLAEYWDIKPMDSRVRNAAALHGQDVPVCLTIENNYITSDGVMAAHDLPHVDVVMINPNKGLSTPLVYNKLREIKSDFSPPAQLECAPTTVAELVYELKQRRNDLEPPAELVMPEIREILVALEASPECLLARMSGSGATCFGLYDNRSTARAATSKLMTLHPNWWIVQTHIPYKAPEVHRD